MEAILHWLHFISILIYDSLNQDVIIFIILCQHWLQAKTYDCFPKWAYITDFTDNSYIFVTLSQQGSGIFHTADLFCADETEASFHSVIQHIFCAVYIFNIKFRCFHCKQLREISFSMWDISKKAHSFLLLSSFLSEQLPAFHKSSFYRTSHKTCCEIFLEERICHQHRENSNHCHCHTDRG